jgi:hypothetical protein
LDEANKKARTGDGDNTDVKALSRLIGENLIAFSSKGPRIASLTIPEADTVQGSSSGSVMSPREQRILQDALKNKTITRNDFELLTSLETNPGETEKALRGAGVKIVTFGQTTVRGEAKRKLAKKTEPSEIDALNELQDPSVKAAIEARRVKPASSSGADDLLEQLMQKAIKEGRQPTDGDFIACSERTKADIFGVHEAPVSNHFDHSMIAFYASNGDPRAQELLSQMKKAGLMLPSPQDIEHSRRTHERFVQFVQRAMPTSSSGADDQRAKMVEDTRRRLADIKDAAAKGDKSAQNKWSNAQANYKKAQARAAKGDGRSKELASMLNDTGLFT